MAVRQHVDAHALDDHLDQLVVRHAPDYPTVAGAAGRPGPRPRRDHEAGDERAGDEAADVGEERDAAVRLDQPDRGEPVDELEHEPEAQHDDRRHVDQLVEEAQEHQRRDPGAREEDDVRARGSPRSRRTPRSSGSPSPGATAPGPGPPPRRPRGRRAGTRRGRGGPRCCWRRSTGRAGCPTRCSQPPWRNWLVTSVAVSCDRKSPRPQAAVRSAGTTPHAVTNRSSAGSPPFASSPSS